jgi:hypothetical protein
MVVCAIEAIMEFFTVSAPNGLIYNGLISLPRRGLKAIFAHVHGWGGDHYSNPFVRYAHESYPSIGFGFASFSTRISHYLTESYSDSAVAYNGAAIHLPDIALSDIDEVVRHLAGYAVPIFLQGHSFGTNLVKTLLETDKYESRGLLAGAVYLSPADSVGLLTRHETERSTASKSSALLSGDTIVVGGSSFGISVANRRYEIPISNDVWQGLKQSPTFNAWSRFAVSRDLQNIPALVVRAEADPISNYGTLSMGDFERLCGPSTEFISLSGDSHIFKDRESQLVELEAAWAVRVLGQM